MMAEYDLLVLNGLVVTDQETNEFDIAIKDEKIAKLVPRGTLSVDMARKTIDAEGALVLPGGIDAHVHLGTTLTLYSQVKREK